MNEYDSERIAQGLLDAGWQVSPDAEGADLLLLNTCTVRQLAEQKAFSLLGRWIALKRRRPEVVIGMVGCLAQHLAQDAFKRAPEIDFIAGPRALTRIPELAEKAGRFRHGAEIGDSGYGHGVTTPVFHGWQARVAVMEGCNQFCAYCAVPHARGREMSRPVEDILQEVEKRLMSGAREIMLLGQNVNHYGFDLGKEMDFAELLRQVAQLPGVSRIRFMTSHPKDFSPRLIKALAEIPHVCQALHLPLQSGADAVLSAMRRGYTLAAYRDLVERLRAAVPGIGLSTDLIVGFPGETEEDFQATVQAVRDLNFDMAYCFKFSPRQGTVAATLPGAVFPDVREKRLGELLENIRQAAVASQAGHVGKREKVLVEEMDPSRTGHVKGRTPINHWVSFPGPESWLGTEVPVNITAAYPGGLLGEPETK
ncbi:MAG: tRNA (N6-isopentenyl adenosine(37)-C2)-methylthiotransferase MiaB [Candidatus Firestonebacteria bacterium]|nr:tRNA (N6-isopentenyl adenosine(37)-C2)-methylthiotransferase MiaB [Candidatus Firestonebacteria bacterium]